MMAKVDPVPKPIVESKPIRDFRDRLDRSFGKETELYETFFKRITDYAKTHRHIAINRLTEVEERLETLKTEAVKLQDSILFHDETVIVKRQETIAHTEAAVHQENLVALSHDRDRLEESVRTIEHLSQALLQVKSEFFDTYQRHRLKNLLSTEDFFSFFNAKSREVEEMLTKHHEIVYQMFLDIDAKIRELDLSLTDLIQNKNKKIATIDSYFSNVMQHYNDNQLTFSAETDPTSITVQALESDKINQYNQYRSHKLAEHAKLKNYLTDEYKTLFNTVYQDALVAKALDLFDLRDFFARPESYIEFQKQEISVLDDTLDRVELRKANHKLRLMESYETIAQKVHAKTTRRLKEYCQHKTELIRMSEIDTDIMTDKLGYAIDAYLALMDVDPFLAQIIGDDATKIIKDELNRLSILRANRELKANIDYDIKMTRIKRRLNELENEMMSQVRSELVVQEHEALAAISEIRRYLTKRQYESAKERLFFDKERLLVERLQNAANEHLSRVLEGQKVNRKWIAGVTAELVKNVRSAEAHQMDINDARKELDLLLKEYDIKALHFETIYQNEIAFLISQKSRVDAETNITNAFILTTYQNQMRFAEEQIAFADHEFRMRAESLDATITQERSFFDNVIKTEHVRFEAEKRRLEEEYQALYYSSQHALAETTDKKAIRSHEARLAQAKADQTSQQTKLIAELDKNPKILDARLKLERLDRYYQTAIADAEILRDATVSEFRDLYTYAKTRYDALKPYLEDSIGIMDPAFFDQIDRINKRHQDSIRSAETELDQKSGDYLLNYVKVYFTSDQNDLTLSYLPWINEIVAERETVESAFQARLDACELDYRTKAQALDMATSLLAADSRAKLAEFKTREDQNNTTYQTLRSQAEAERHTLLDQIVKNSEKTIAELMKEYRVALVTNREFVAKMASDFDKVVDAYKPYIRFAKHQTPFGTLIHRLKRDHRRGRKLRHKAINAAYRNYKIAPE